MIQLSQLWQSLDDAPQAGADRRAWRLRLGEEWGVGRQFLKPTGQLARAIDCPSPGGDGCPRVVVPGEDRQYRAVCGNQPRECDTLDLSRDDIVILALDKPALAASLAAVLDLRPDYFDEGPVLRLGLHVASSGLMPVILLLQEPTTDELVAPMTPRPSAILLPTRKTLPKPVTDLLAARGHLLLFLSEIVGADGDGDLTATAPMGSLIGALGRSTGGSDHVFWLLPADARWEELRFEFTAAEAAIVRFREGSRAADPTRLHMRNTKSGKATLDWVLLRTLVQLGGHLPRPQKASTAKQKQLLAGKLRQQFGLSGDPIPFDTRLGAYVARFGTLDSMPKRTG